LVFQGIRKIGTRPCHGPAIGGTRETALFESKAPLNTRQVAEDDKLNDLFFIDGKIESEHRRLGQTSLVKSAVNISGNDAIPVILNGFDDGECELVGNDLESGPASDIPSGSLARDPSVGQSGTKPVCVAVLVHGWLRRNFCRY
jgi:hypothetical protein